MPILDRLCINMYTTEALKTGVEYSGHCSVKTTWKGPREVNLHICIIFVWAEVDRSWTQVPQRWRQQMGSSLLTTSSNMTAIRKAKGSKWNKFLPQWALGLWHPWIIYSAEKKWWHPGLLTFWMTLRSLRLQHWSVAESQQFRKQPNVKHISMTLTPRSKSSLSLFLTLVSYMKSHIRASVLIFKVLTFIRCLWIWKFSARLKIKHGQRLFLAPWQNFSAPSSLPWEACGGAGSWQGLTDLWRKEPMLEQVPWLALVIPWGTYTRAACPWRTAPHGRVTHTTEFEDSACGMGSLE